MKIKLRNMELKNITKKTWIYKDLAFIIPLKLLRKTPSVEFYNIVGVISDLSSIDKVIHEENAFSPRIPSDKKHYWYMHPYQEDRVVVHEGKRIIDLYSKKHGKIEKFEVTSNTIKHEGKILYKGAAILGWPRYVFHRIKSPKGSISTNYAKHYSNFDIKSNFNIYDLDVKTKNFTVVREGHKDQPKKR